MHQNPERKNNNNKEINEKIYIHTELIRNKRQLTKTEKITLKSEKVEKKQYLKRKTTGN